MPTSILLSQVRCLGFALMLPVLVIAGVVATPWQSARGQTGQTNRTGQTGQTDGGPLTLRSDIQEANSQTGVVTARGNVQIYYPARQIQLTSIAFCGRWTPASQPLPPPCLGHSNSGHPHFARFRCCWVLLEHGHD